MNWGTSLGLLSIINACMQLIILIQMCKNLQTSLLSMNNHVWDVHRLKYEAYLKDFNKRYTTVEEYEIRFDNFKASLKEIAKLNALEGNTVFGLTKFSDFSKKEFADRMLMKPVKSPPCPRQRTCKRMHPSINTSRNIDTDNIKLAFDWRDKGFVKPVLNQKLCNGCWAFSIVGVMETMSAIRYGDLASRSIQASLKEIAKLNALEGNTVFGLTKFSDFSKKEFADRMLMKPVKSPPCPRQRTCKRMHPSINTSRNIDTDNIKLAFDWRDKGFVKPVLNQKLCNGCWAFSIVGVMETMSAIRYGDLASRSIQELLDCSDHTNGCRNGSVSIAMDFLCDRPEGVVTEEEYPLTLTDEICTVPIENNGRKVQDFRTECNRNEMEMLSDISNHGPLVAAVDASNWQNYISGVIHRACNPGYLTHVIQIVGYKMDTDLPYYIIRNSYGTDFGEEGYVRIAINENVCGIADQLEAGRRTLKTCLALSLVSAMVTLVVEHFGVYKEKKVKKFTWRTSSGTSVSTISYGAIVQSITVPDKLGVTKDVVLGFDDLDGYVNRNTPYLGATVGRCANRIGNASFEIDGKTYQVAKNIGKHHLHGGIVGFDKVVWDDTLVGSKVVFSYHSKDMEEGYPGDLITNVTYELKDDNRLHVEFQAVTTKRTVVNLTNHSYFNLAGHDAGAQELYNHRVTINADRITSTDSDSIPTGGFTSVLSTPFDFNVERKLGDAMSSGSNLFDDNYCVNTHGSQGLTFVASVCHPSSGRYLEVYSDQPGVQFYTSNGLPAPSDSALIGKNGVGYRRHGAFCLETQKFPDAVHHTNFPSTILRPGEVYKHRVVYAFGVSSTNNVEPAVVPA